MAYIYAIVFNMAQDDYIAMLSSGKLILRGKRWRKFHEFTVVPILLGLMSILGWLAGIQKRGFYFDWQLIPFISIPVLFTAWWIPYKNKELRFTGVSTPYEKKENYRIVINALNKLDWTIKEETDSLIEAYTSPMYGLPWGTDMMTVLIADNRILVNSLSSLEKVKNQAFFTFGALKRNTKQLINEITEEMNRAHNNEVSPRRSMENISPS
jgi:hypothetical protein